MDQRLRTHTDLTEDSSLILNIHSGRSQLPAVPVPKEPMSLYYLGPALK